MPEIRTITVTEDELSVLITKRVAEVLEVNKSNPSFSRTNRDNLGTLPSKVNNEPKENNVLGRPKIDYNDGTFDGKTLESLRL